MERKPMSTVIPSTAARGVVPCVLRSCGRGDLLFLVLKGRSPAPQKAISRTRKDVAAERGMTVSVNKMRGTHEVLDR